MLSFLIVFSNRFTPIGKTIDMGLYNMNWLIETPYVFISSLLVSLDIVEDIVHYLLPKIYCFVIWNVNQNYEIFIINHFLSSSASNI